MKITDIKAALIGNEYIIRVCTDKDIDGYCSFEVLNVAFSRDILEWYKRQLIGVDPTSPTDVMRRIRRMGGNKPWGKYVSAIEVACWDISGKEAGVPSIDCLEERCVTKSEYTVRAIEMTCFRGNAPRISTSPENALKIFARFTNLVVLAL